MLLLDDYEPDLALLTSVLKSETEFRIVHKARDGGDVITYLKGDPPYDDRQRFPMPHLLIIDLKMMKVDGFDILQWIKANKLIKLVTVVLTGSTNPADEALAYELCADIVLHKPIGLENIRKLVCSIETFMETAPKGVHC
ncbi:MAG TPA: response regulator [Verrucomicrobiae bacterium]|nr:response regulator [Verrucomicrobiae bacterium]